MIDHAWAGHAGETTITAFMPHELMGGIVLLLLVLLVLVGLTAATLFKVLRLERRLGKVEAALKQPAGNGAGPG